VTETANEPELTKKTLENSIFHLLEAFHHIFHDGTCKIKTLITEEGRVSPYDDNFHHHFTLFEIFPLPISQITPELLHSLIY
jgi:hypothetical protein